MNVITATSKPLAKMPRAAVLLLDLLTAVRGGRLDIALPDGSKYCIDDGGAIHASLQVHDWRMFEQVPLAQRHWLRRQLYRRPMGFTRSGLTAAPAGDQWRQSRTRRQWPLF